MKILIVHNKYSQLGGEDINIDREIKLLESEYVVESFIYKNLDQSLFNNVKSLAFNSNNSINEAFLKKLNEFKPDIVYVHNTWFTINLGIFDILKNLKIDTVIKLHNFRFDCAEGNHLRNNKLCHDCDKTRLNGIKNKCYQNSYILSALATKYGLKYFNILKDSKVKILVLSDFHKEYLIQKGIDRKKIFKYFNPLAILEPIEQSFDDKNQLIYAGRIDNSKGLDLMIDSFLKAELKYNLKLIGEGSMLNSLKEQYKNFPNILFTGHLDNAETRKEISLSRASLFTSHMYEGQPVFLCESSELKVPSVFPDIGGIKEFFPMNYPLSYKYNSQSDLVKKMKLLSDDKLLAKCQNQVSDHILELLNNETLLKKFKGILNV